MRLGQREVVMATPSHTHGTDISDETWDHLKNLHFIIVFSFSCFYPNNANVENDLAIVEINIHFLN